MNPEKQYELITPTPETGKIPANSAELIAYLNECFNEACQDGMGKLEASVRMALSYIRSGRAEDAEAVLVAALKGLYGD